VGHFQTGGAAGKTTRQEIPHGDERDSPWSFFPAIRHKDMDISSTARTVVYRRTKKSEEFPISIMVPFLVDGIRMAAGGGTTQRRWRKNQFWQDKPPEPNITRLYKLRIWIKFPEYEVEKDCLHGDDFAIEIRRHRQRILVWATGVLPFVMTSRGPMFVRRVSWRHTTD